jgi:hypothetical protein
VGAGLEGLGFPGGFREGWGFVFFFFSCVQMPQQSHHPHHQRGGARNGGSGAQLVVDERLQQLVLRMRSALQLGFRSSSSL